MGHAKPVLNCKPEPEVKAAFELLAGRKSIKPGTLLKQIVDEHTIAQLAIETMKREGFVETNRRLTTSTYRKHSMDHVSDHAGTMGALSK